MSMINEVTGCIRSKSGITIEQITNTIQAAIGQGNFSYYFPPDETITSEIDPDTGDAYVSIDFGQIPYEHDTAIIERAMIAIAPLIRDDGEVAVMYGLLSGESYIYQFRNGIVQFAEAELRPVRNAHWKTLVDDPNIS